MKKNIGASIFFLCLSSCYFVDGNEKVGEYGKVIEKIRKVEKIVVSVHDWEGEYFPAIDYEFSGSNVGKLFSRYFTRFQGNPCKCGNHHFDISGFEFGSTNEAINATVDLGANPPYIWFLDQEGIVAFTLSTEGRRFLIAQRTKFKSNKESWKKRNPY